MIGRTKALTIPSSSAAAMRVSVERNSMPEHDLRSEPKPDPNHHRANEEPFHDANTPVAPPHLAIVRAVRQSAGDDTAGADWL